MLIIPRNISLYIPSPTLKEYVNYDIVWVVKTVYTFRPSFDIYLRNFVSVVFVFQQIFTKQNKYRIPEHILTGAEAGGGWHWT